MRCTPGRAWIRAALSGPLLLYGWQASVAADGTGDLLPRQPWEPCTYCHGGGGAINDPQIPSLAGQSAGYLRKQLADFRSGRRSDPSRMMTSALLLLEPTQDATVADFFANRPPPEQGRRLRSTDSEQGAQLYWHTSPTAAACASCHDPSDAAQPGAHPRLAGQSRGYLATQLRRFRDGSRRNDVDAVMRDNAAALSDDGISAITNYLGRR